ncbi:hypothetical protein TEA_022498 [Camellia sinensis var. sinensis]|uniref:YqgF/RNase H-like domain-containing protein n=1 Tax=Camellia sinensis var. sinensis TaxID=542762 RepID=A0A4S4EPM7_CAMSN|nr:hypothetical protein TEA_022498 [Camellia sinensis var. sinensis]
MALHLGVPLSSLTHPALRKGTSALNPHRLPSTIHMCKCPTIRALSSEEIPPNALRWKRDPTWRGGFSLRVDLGMSRTGLALSKGFSIRPLTVLELRGQKLELRLIEIAERQETQQSNKVRGVAGRFAVRAAEYCSWMYCLFSFTDLSSKNAGLEVYLQDEHGTSTEAMNLMIDRGFVSNDKALALWKCVVLWVLWLERNARIFEGREDDIEIRRILDNRSMSNIDLAPAPVSCRVDTGTPP